MHFLAAREYLFFLWHETFLKVGLRSRGHESDPARLLYCAPVFFSALTFLFHGTLEQARITRAKAQAKGELVLETLGT